MTNEHDVTIARIGAALALVQTPTPLGDAATKYLEWEFGVAQQVKEEQLEKQEPSTVLGGPHCTAVRPGRSLKHSDALQCFLRQGHDGPHDFRSVPGEPRRGVSADEFG